MIPVLISWPTALPNEGKVLVQLFEQGLQHFHLRRPGLGYAAVKELLEQLPEKYHSRVIVHYHFEAQKEFDIKGIHFSKSNITEASGYLRTKIHRSASFHSFEEFDNSTENFDYVFISPVFNSISKSEYKAGFSLEELGCFLKKQRKHKVIALGGIDKGNVGLLRSVGFQGFAILGSFWKLVKEGKELEALEYWSKILANAN